jgi:hypothetical protein
MNHRLQHLINQGEASRAERIEKAKAKTGRKDLPLAERKLTGQEAAAYCNLITINLQPETR